MRTNQYWDYIIEVVMVNQNDEYISYEYNVYHSGMEESDLRTLILRAIDKALFMNTPEGEPQPRIESIRIKK